MTSFFNLPEISIRSVYGERKVVCIIPARLNSRRFPRKVLARLHSKPLIQHVWESAVRCTEFSDVILGVDSWELAREVDRFGGKFCVTDINCPSGTHRIIDVIEKMSLMGDVFVNWQSDMLLLSLCMVRDLLQTIVNQEQKIWTLKKTISAKDGENRHITKVVTDKFGKALYFSRRAIPFDVFAVGEDLHKHIGIYAYDRDTLMKIKKLPYVGLAQKEQLEQLLFLEEGFSIYVHSTKQDSLEINTPEDLQKVSRIMEDSEFLMSA